MFVWIGRHMYIVDMIQSFSSKNIYEGHPGKQPIQHCAALQTHLTFISEKTEGSDKTVFLIQSYKSK